MRRRVRYKLVIGGEGEGLKEVGGRTYVASKVFVYTRY